MGPEKTALQGDGTPLNVCIPPLKYEGLFTITYTTLFLYIYIIHMTTYHIPCHMHRSALTLGGTSLQYVVCYGTKKEMDKRKEGMFRSTPAQR